MSQYFPKPYDLSNYAIKANLKNATGTNTSKLGLKLLT